MLTPKTLYFLQIPLKLGFKAIYVFLGYHSATGLTVFLVLAIQLSVIGWITSAPTQIIETKITNIDEFGISDSSIDPQITRTLNWARIKTASLVIFFGVFSALICYLIGSLFSPH